MAEKKKGTVKPEGKIADLITGIRKKVASKPVKKETGETEGDFEKLPEADDTLKVSKPKAKTKEITSLTVQADLKKVQSDNSLLINRKIKAGQNVKIDLIVKNRLRVLLNQLDRFMRLDTKKYA